MGQISRDSLQERQAVADTLVRYATSIDSRDWPRYRSCFGDAVHADLSSWSGAPAALIPSDAWVEGVKAGLSGFDATQHLLSNAVVRMREGVAECTMYVQATHHLVDEEIETPYALGGYYANRLVRVADDWKIERLQLVVTWSRGDRRLMDRARERAS